MNFILGVPEMVDGILSLQDRMEKDAANFTKGSKISSFLGGTDYLSEAFKSTLCDCM